MDIQTKLGTGTMLYGRQIKALLRCSGDMDIRYYLNGVYFDPEGYAVATNGHILLAIKCEPFAGAGFIVPNEVLRAGLKRVGDSKSRRYVYAILPTIIDDVGYKAIDGKFPDWRRVVPAGIPAHGKKAMVPAINGERAYYDPRYLTIFERCAEDLAERDIGRAWVQVFENGDSPGVVTSRNLDLDVLAIIMPMRVDTIDAEARIRIEANIDGFMKAAREPQKSEAA